jgi:diguanylate cyclase (GGDEF)-like protein
MDKKSIFPLSINNYALTFLFIVAAFFSGIGFYAYSSIEEARTNIQHNNRLAAYEELSQSVAHLVDTVTSLQKHISNWDELFQQLDNPAYYSYWREYRLHKADILPDYIDNAEVFDRNGRALALMADSVFPEMIDVTSLEPSLNVWGDDIYIVTYLPIKRVGPMGVVEGYLGVRLSLIQTLLGQYRFRYIDIDTLDSSGEIDNKLPLSNLDRVMDFEIKSSPEAEMMMKIVDVTVIQLATIIGVLCLLFYFLLVYLLGKPLLEISEYIDKLLYENPGSLKDDINQSFQVAELEKVKSSLIKYHSDLEKAHIDLDEKNQELWQLAHHDTLTGMLNRRAYEAEWHNSKQLLRRRRVDIGLILFDVNHFKAINDSYGHQSGDEVLKAISSCIQSVLRSAEELYRIGGDEFAAIIIGSRKQDEVELAQRCIDAVAENDFSETGIKETIRISCGISHCQADELEKLDNLQWQADVAVYQAKRPGVTRPVLFSEEMADGTEAMFSSWIRDAVYEAVTNGTGAEVHYQPIVNTESREAEYYEALIRIRSGDELIPPSHIFPIITMRQMDTALDRVVISKVKDDIENDLIPRGKGISINLSAESLAHKDIIEWLMPLTDFTQSYYLVIEVTETSLITQISTAVRNLTLLRKLGFKVALDDFGSGYSSLRYLTSMPVDIVKFDITLIQGMLDQRLEKVVQEMANMLIDLGYDLVAEGIETDELLQKIKHAGFKLSQGYLFGGATRERSIINKIRLAQD